MENALLELVELPNGEIVLKRLGDSDEEPLVNIRFSPDALNMMGDQRLDIARAMVQAGIDAASASMDEDDVTAIFTEAQPTLH